MSFTPEQINNLNTLFETLKAHVPLGHWKVNLFFSTADEMDDIAGSATTYGVTKIKEHMEFANIYLNVDAVYLEWDTPEHTLIHEFIHVTHYPLDSYIKTTYDTNAYYDELFEQYINHMSYALYNLMQ